MALWAAVEEGQCDPVGPGPGHGHWCQDSPGAACQIGYGHDADAQSPCGSTSFTEYGETFHVPLHPADELQLLALDLTDNYGAAVREETVGWNLSQDQFNALTDLNYNAGDVFNPTDAPTLYGYLQNVFLNHAALDPGTVTADFEAWDKQCSGTGAGRVCVPLQDLYNRRWREAQMFLYGQYTSSSPATTVSDIESCTNDTLSV